MHPLICIIIGVVAIVGSLSTYLSKDYDSSKYSSNQAFKFMLMGIAGVIWGIILYLSN
jgi:hypothetical protein